MKWCLSSSVLWFRCPHSAFYLSCIVLTHNSSFFPGLAENSEVSFDICSFVCWMLNALYGSVVREDIAVCPVMYFHFTMCMPSCSCCGPSKYNSSVEILLTASCDPSRLNVNARMRIQIAKRLVWRSRASTWMDIVYGDGNSAQSDTIGTNTTSIVFFRFILFVRNPSQSTALVLLPCWYKQYTNAVRQFRLRGHQWVPPTWKEI